MKIGRNDLCPCGSGKKFKKCHLQTNSFPLPNESRSIRERNLMLISAFDEIFGFNKGITWDDFRKNISDDQVRELYRFIDWLWPIQTDVLSLLPEPSKVLRGLYIGEMKPQGIVKNILRYSLYTDEIIVVNPFQHPRTLAPDFNPIIKPAQYKQDTLEMVFFVAALLPWIEKGVVNLIPDIADFDPTLRKSVWSLAEKRFEGKNPNDYLSKEEMEQIDEDGKEMLLRMISRLPAEAQIQQIKKVLPNLSEEKVHAQLEYIKRQKKAHHLWLDQPIPQDGELRVMRMGANLELGMFIAQLTGSYLYTNRPSQWKEILETKQGEAESELWSPLTNAFQQLEFDFLDNVSADFVVNLKEEERLSSLRNFLRRVWKEIEAKERPPTESAILNFKDELIEEHTKAKDEWKQIDHKLRDWVLGKGTMASGAALGVSQILTGGMNWQIPAIGFCINAVNELLNSRASRKSFRANTPLSVFIDLDNSKRKIHK